MKLSCRKQYAEKRLKMLGKNPNKEIFTRGFDSCFEESDADKVVAFLERKAINDPVLKEGLRIANIKSTQGTI